MSDDADDAELTAVDREALSRCLAAVLAGALGGEEAQLIKDALPGRGWFWCARSASFHLQMAALNLKIWEVPPSRFECSEPGEARALADRLRANNLSIYEASPLEALAKAAAATKPKPRRDRTGRAAKADPPRRRR